MNREEYLKRLSFLLKDLPEEEIEDAIAYYEDYFEEAGEEKEEQVIKDTSNTSLTSCVILYPYVPSSSLDTTARTTASNSAAPVLKTIGILLASYYTTYNIIFFILCQLAVDFLYSVIYMKRNLL